MKKYLLPIITLSITITGCTIGPDFQKPQIKTENIWTDIIQDQNIDTEQYNITAQWWEVFADPTLNTLLANAQNENLSLQIAALRVLEAQALRGIAKGYQFPQMQQVGASYTRQNNSENNANHMPVTEYSEYRNSFDVAWELDIWGRYRRALQAADAQLDSLAMNYNHTWLTISAEIALAYTELCAFDQRIKLLQKNIEIHNNTFELVQARYDAGAATELDLQQARTMLFAVQSSMPVLRSGQQSAISRLCILSGLAPGQLDDLLAQRQTLPDVSPQISIGMPADLLRRRPDIRIAEYNALAASAQIGVEKADLLPQLSLNGSVGYSAEQAKNLFSSASQNTNFGPSIRWNILNYGRITNRVKAADIRLQQALAAYDLAIIQALNETEIAIFTYLQTQQQAQFLAQSETASQKALDLALEQYNSGLVSFDRVLDAQSFLLQQQDKLTLARRDVIHNLIVIYKALGGSWNMHQEI